VEDNDPRVLDLLDPNHLQKAKEYLGNDQNVRPIVKSGANCTIFGTDKKLGRVRTHPLHTALSVGHVRTHLKLGANLLAQGKSGVMPLFRAAEHGDASLIWELFKIEGCGSAALIHATASGELAAYISALKGHFEATEALLEECDATGVPWEELCKIVTDGWNCLHAAGCGRNGETAELLLSKAEKKGCLRHLVTAKTKHGATPLHVAARAGGATLLRNLIN
jgi:ankyrin repeat protein